MTTKLERGGGWVRALVVGSLVEELFLRLSLLGFNLICDIFFEYKFNDKYFIYICYSSSGIAF